MFAIEKLNEWNKKWWLGDWVSNIRFNKAMLASHWWSYRKLGRIRNICMNESRWWKLKIKVKVTDKRMKSIIVIMTDTFFHNKKNEKEEQKEKESS